MCGVRCIPNLIRIIRIEEGTDPKSALHGGAPWTMELRWIPYRQLAACISLQFFLINWLWFFLKVGSPERNSRHRDISNSGDKCNRVGKVMIQRGISRGLPRYQLPRYGCGALSLTWTSHAVTICVYFVFDRNGMEVDMYIISVPSCKLRLHKTKKP